MKKISEKQQQLVDKLKELFQMDQADLDFGIYRIMNAKHDEIEKFLNDDLLPAIRQTLQAGGKATDVQKDLDETILNLQNAGVDPDTSPKVQELKALLSGGSNIEKDEGEIFSHLYTFFSRYYDGGDFMSLRRYKKETYSPLPMNGEEVKLHWANADQYYIKSAENFTNYAFKVGEEGRQRRVRFELVSASTEQNNNKSDSNNDRQFVLFEDKPIRLDDGDSGLELIISFEYRVDAKKRKQKDLNVEAKNYLYGLDAIEGINDWDDWKTSLTALAPTEKNKERTIFEKHLLDYTAKNSFDYFIHKDLGGFLRRELEFYIKSELILIDDVLPNDVDSIRQQIITNDALLGKVIAFKTIGMKIISLLSQIENFQKKLWLKKKFVLETNWLISLDVIGVIDELYEIIFKNKVQLEEWEAIYGLDKIKLNNDCENLDWCDLLKVPEYKRLVLNTKNFSVEFKYKMLSFIEDIDGSLDGEIVNGENFQALTLLNERHRGTVDMVYVDPPYNTGGDGFLYKDNYRHSSWLSLVQDRLQASRDFLSDTANYFASIDDNENIRLRNIMDSVFGDDSFESQIIVQSNKRGQTYQSIAKTHEYMLCYRPGFLSEIVELEKEVKENTLRDEIGAYELWELRNRNPKFGRFNRPNLYYPIYVDLKSLDENGYAKISLDRNYKDDVEVVPLNSEGAESCWRWSTKKLLDETTDTDRSAVVAKQKRDGGWNIYQKARKSTTKSKSIWLDTSFISEQGTVELGHYGFTDFGFPKPSALIRQAIKIGAISNSKIMDFFSGSGTTGQAVLDLNREDGGKRTFLLVEMGRYVESIILPRLMKTAYSSNWNGGKPLALKEILHIQNKKIRDLGKQIKDLSGYLDKDDYLFDKQLLEEKINGENKYLKRIENKVKNGDIGHNGKSIFIKYIKLESYEDCCENLTLFKDEEQDRLIEENSNFKEDYYLNYQFDVEAKESLFPQDIFVNPFKSKMKHGGEEYPLDLVETFNYLLGLRVKTMRLLKSIYEIVGILPNGSNVLILWRNTNEVDNDTLDAWFKKQSYNSRDMEFNLIYVNGDNNLPNLRTGEESWKVQLIEEAFHTLMFDVKDL